jgi:hypothetical protein
LVAFLGDTLGVEHMRRMAAYVGVADVLEQLLAGG